MNSAIHSSLTGALTSGLGRGFASTDAALRRLGIVSHFKNLPEPDGTLLSSIGDEERPLQPGRCYDFDGVNDKITFTGLAGGVTIVSNDGTAALTINAGATEITADSGTAWNILLSDGSLYKCDENAGTTAYDSSGNGNHGAIQNATLSSFHAEQDVYSYQNQVGYTEGDGSNGAVVGVFIPRDESDIAKDVLGNPLQYNGLSPHPWG